MRIALVHDWFTKIGGAERVLLHMHALWPSAPVHLLVADRTATATWMPNADIVVSSLQRIPGITRAPQYALPFMPSAIESFELSSYDVVVSSSVLFAKGIVIRPGTRHICYCYSPARPLWDRTHAPEYRGIASSLARHLLRVWDAAASHRPDVLVAPSRAVQDRIRKWYRRDAIVIPPPATLGTVSTERQPFILAVARLTPHKHLEQLLDAFGKLRDTLVIVGEGPLYRRLQSRATPNVRLTGWVSDEHLSRLYRSCTAVIVASSEDWGLTAVEAMSYGKPVLALRRGGALEIVLEGVTGEFFDDPIPEAIADGVKRIRSLSQQADPHTIARHASSFDASAFDARMQTLVQGV
jgi:glycosyltransferase involved in cell wall biosynthesis